MSTITRLSADELAAALVRNPKDDHRAAAETLLIEHDSWLRRADFRDCVLYDADDDSALIRWWKVREFLDSGPRASTSELAILDLACALGEDRFRLSAMGHAHRDMIRTAITAAVERH